MGRTLGYAGQFLILRVANATLRLDVPDGLPLSFIQAHAEHDFIRQPVSPDGDGELFGLLLEAWFWEVVRKAFADHHEGAGAVFLDVTGKEQYLGRARIAQNGTMRLPQTLGRQG